MTRKLTLALLAVCTLAASGCTVQATRDFSFTRPWGAYERVVVNTANGRVRLTCGHVDELSIAGRTRARGTTFARAKENLDALEVIAQPDEQDAGTLRVAVRVPANLSQMWSGTDFEIRTPAPCAAEITTSNGAIYVADTKACVRLETSNGAIDVERSDGGVEARTSNGRIKALCVAGDLAARTSNGAIQVENVRGSCRLNTSNGTIKVLAAGGPVDATTSNGSIRFEATDRLEAGPTGSAGPTGGTGSTDRSRPTAELRTSNGAISLLLPRQLQGELRLNTSNAPIHARLLNITANIHYQAKDELHATLNGGGPARVAAETSNGPIHVDFR